MKNKIKVICYSYLDSPVKKKKNLSADVIVIKILHHCFYFFQFILLIDVEKVKWEEVNIYKNFIQIYFVI